MRSNDGGPAFPQNDATVNRINNEAGMSLRDWFAGQALVSMVRAIGEGSGNVFDASRAKTAAISAYEFADAMLAEREEPQP